MFCATVSEREQRAVLEQHAPARARLVAPLARAQLGADRLPNTSIRARGRPVEADDRAQQHRLAGARAADDAQHLAAVDVEVEMVVDDLRAEPVDEAAHRDDGRRIAASGVRSPRRRGSRTTASSDDDEEDRLDHRRRWCSRPTLSALPLDLHPFVAADHAR